MSQKEQEKIRLYFAAAISVRKTLVADYELKMEEPESIAQGKMLHEIIGHEKGKIELLESIRDDVLFILDD